MNDVPRRLAVLGAVTTGQRSRSRSLGSIWIPALRQTDEFDLEFVPTVVTASDKTWRDWRTLATEDSIDAIFVADDSPETLDAARYLAARGVTLLIPASATLPPEFVAELSLFDAEDACTLIPLLGSRVNPLLRKLRRTIADGKLGTVSSIEMDREIRRDGEGLLDPPSRNARLLADVDSLRTLGGDYSQVTLMRTGNEEQPVAETLQLSGPGLPDATTVTRLATGNPAFELRVHGSAGIAVVRPIGNTTVLEVNGAEIDRTDARPTRQTWHADLLHESLLRTSDSARWKDVVRAFEIIEATNRSLKKRRTIDLHFETASERSQFKTHMAAIGCGVILWTMFGIIGLLFAGAVLDPRDDMQREAQAAGFVLRDDEFARGTANLTGEGRQHLEQIAGRMNLNESVVFIEAIDAPDSKQSLDDARRTDVWDALSSIGVEDSNRIVVRPLRGLWFARTMQLARLLVFAPVGLFLLVQVLLLITKPAASRSGSSSQDEFNHSS